MKVFITSSGLRYAAEVAEHLSDSCLLHPSEELLCLLVSVAPEKLGHEAINVGLAKFDVEVGRPPNAPRLIS